MGTEYSRNTSLRLRLKTQAQGRRRVFCAHVHGLESPPSVRCYPMSVKYYTHFLMQERQPKGLSEFRGVVEVNRVMPRGDLREATAVLARNFECDTKDIKILQWSRLH
jgi:hypothetical protein